MTMPLDKRLNAFRDDLADIRLKGRVEAARFVEGTPARVRNPLVSLRRRPAGDAPLETEALFGEGVLVFEAGTEGWSFVQLEGDSYVGWMESEALGPVGAAPQWKVGAPRTLVFPGPDIKQPPLMALPMGALVVGTGEASDRNADYVTIAPYGAIVRQHLVPVTATQADFVSVAERFLGTPYLWGGKSTLGIDCTGLVQIACSMAGISAPRDSDLQEAWAEVVREDAPRSRGELVFWKGHVGIMLDETRLLHANAHHMMTAVEPLAEAVARIGGKGVPVSSIRRIPAIA